MFYIKINPETGIYIEDAIFENPPSKVKVTIDNEIVMKDEYISVPCPYGFYLPKWDGEKWAEGGIAPKPIPQIPTDSERLDAIESAISKLMGV